MSVEQFKEAILVPLRSSVDQQMQFTLGQVGSENDAIKQYARMQAMRAVIDHIESTYNSLFNKSADNAPQVEIIPPQA